ncbi:uncharacterized protein LOC115888968 isoform X2 [Sitophilus oryzae]|nr:uncharacterized protein LOC115888968 isoform X2 [Sitophilus oryzae]
MYLEINVNKFNPIGGSSFVELPTPIRRKEAVVNVRNMDQYCFAWAITSALCPAKSKIAELSSYPHFATLLNIAGLDFPMNLRDIKTFEQLNNISVNVYGLESKIENNKIVWEVVGPLRYTERKLVVHVNLLLLIEDCKVNSDGHICNINCVKTHYCWIKNLSRLVSSQINSHQHKLYFCDGCLLHFSSAHALVLHQNHDCNHVYTSIPSVTHKLDKYGKCVPENILKFENIEKQLRVPFVVYADFESILKPIATVAPSSTKSYTLKSVKHEPYSFAYLIKCSFDDSFSKFETYRGKDAAKEFVSHIENDLRSIYNIYLKDFKKMIPLSNKEKLEFINAKTCFICERLFDIQEQKVRDHCHLTGKYRGAAHGTCNINFKLPNFVPIVFHNLSGYDSHMFIKELCRHGDKIDIIAQSKEKYVSFTKSIYVDDYVGSKGEVKKKYLKLRFIDSFKFLSTSLSNLGNGLSIENFKETKKHFPEKEKFDLMRQKGVFPYTFMDSLKKMNNRSLPTKHEFYDDLNNEHISDVDYQRAKDVWRLFNCKTLGDYSDLYLKSDTLLLCDVFENFRDTSLKIHKLDPLQYYSLPSLSFDSMLRMTKVELELLTDIDMIHFFKNGIRGGVSQCSERKHIANNKFLPNYNPSEPSSFIMYLDATNLYGYSMSQPLPLRDFRWLTEREIIDLDIMNVEDDSKYGYVLEVDIHYPKHLHDKHSDLPFLVENIVPPTETSKLTKLIPNLNDKRKYIVHYQTLKQAIKNDLIVTEIHRVLKFQQSRWLKKYIDFNTELRNKSKTKFKKDLFKLYNNAVFGKTMENVENRKDIKLVTHWENKGKRLGAQALIARPNFKTSSIFTEDLVAIHMGRLKILYDKPIYTGFSILDMSKVVIYDFFYNFIKKKFGADASLLYTDTDSLILKIYTENFYQIMVENPTKFDTSNYAFNNNYNIKKSESILGRMKDEFPSDPIKCFYGTGAKAYYVASVNTEIKKAKGVKKPIIAKDLTVDDYKKVVERGGLIFRKMKSFKSDLHDVYTMITNRVALNSRDDKRYLIPTTTKTLPWGHTDIEFYKTDPDTNLNIFLYIAEQMLRDEIDESV